MSTLSFEDFIKNSKGTTKNVSVVGHETELQKEPSFLQETGQDIKQIGTDISQATGKRLTSVNEAQQAYQSGKQGILQTGFQMFGQGAGYASDVIGAGVKGLVKSVLPQKAEESVKSSLSSVLAPVAQSDTVKALLSKYNSLDESTKRNIDATLGIGSLVTDIATGYGGKKVAQVGLETGLKGATRSAELAGKVATQAGEVASKGMKTIGGDIIPSTERLVQSEVTKALNLTPGDVKNINLSTGNEVGAFLAENNLIGKSIKDTTENIKSFTDANYKTVRQEIGNVKVNYPANTVPQYATALKQIKKQVSDVVGLDDVNKEVDSLLGKKIITLNDIQRAKELLDEHFQLYSVIGDVKSGVEKSGLANIRRDLKSFIEDQVKLKTGADIGQLNNAVSTGKSLMKAIEARSTAGLTRANISPADVFYFLGGTGVSGGNPLVGFAAVLAKKIYESQSFKLKFAKYLDKLNDSKRAKLLNDLQEGKIPDGLKVQSSERPSSVSATPSIKSNTAATVDAINKITTKNNVSNSLIKSNIAQTNKKVIPNKQGGFVKIGGKTFKQIPEATKKEMIQLSDYLNSNKYDRRMERIFDDITLKYNINPDWSNSKIMDTLEKLIESTQTGGFIKVNPLTVGATAGIIGAGITAINKKK